MINETDCMTKYLLNGAQAEGNCSVRFVTAKGKVCRGVTNERIARSNLTPRNFFRVLPPALNEKKKGVCVVRKRSAVEPDAPGEAETCSRGPFGVVLSYPASLVKIRTYFERKLLEARQGAAKSYS